MQNDIGDKWAYVSSLQVSQNSMDVIELDVSIIANDANIAHMFYPGHKPFSGIMIADQEFTCLWCSSPNPITHRHCSQCGAPRGFIIK